MLDYVCKSTYSTVLSIRGTAQNVRGRDSSYILSSRSFTIRLPIYTHNYEHTIRYTRLNNNCYVRWGCDIIQVPYIHKVSPVAHTLYGITNNVEEMKNLRESKYSNNLKLIGRKDNVTIR
jgi:hypothetical protein